MKEKLETQGYATRPMKIDDLPAVVDVMNAYYESMIGVRKTEADLRTQLAMPGFDLQSSSQLVQTRDGRITGVILVSDLDNPPVHIQLSGAVHPDHLGRGIGTYLLQWAEQRARQAIARVPEGVRVVMQTSASQKHAPSVRLFDKLGLIPVRGFWLMMIDLEQPPPGADFPAGYLLCTFKENPDLIAFYRATAEAFQDHWGFVKGQEDQRLKRWQHVIENDPHFDPSLWYMVLDGDEIAAIARCSPNLGEDFSMGFVNTLGVRRDWRRQGLALGLLKHIFHEFYQRGKQRVGLGVDAESLTGATRLYEKAGMYVAQELITYEKELRPGRELGTQVVD